MIYAVVVALVVIAVAAVVGRGRKPRSGSAPRPSGSTARSWPALVALIAVLFLSLMVLRGVPDPWVASLTIFAIALVAWGVWMFLFSGRFRTGTPEFRSRMTHVAFVIFFAIYALGIGAWLTAGLIAAVTGHSSALHTHMHAYGGAPDVLTVGADDIVPFSVDGSRRIREMTFRAGSRARIDFTNSPAPATTSCTTLCNGNGEAEGTPIEHNIAIYRTQGDPVFVGAHVTPARATDGPDKGFLVPATITYEFDAPAAGRYVYRCDVHPLIMRGSVEVLPSSAPVTHPTTEQGFRDIARRIAEVSHQAESTRDVTLDYAFSFVSLGLGIFLVLLRPRERMARLFGVAMVGTAAAYNLQSHAALASLDTFDLLHTYFHPLTGITYIYALVLFPDGKLIPRFSNRLVRIAYRIAFFVAVMIFLAVTGSALPDFGQHPAALVLTFGMAIPVIGIIAQSFRLRRAPTSEARQQSRLLLLALGASFALGVVLLLALGINIGALFRPTLADPAAIGAADGRAFRVFQPLFVVIPLALFAGIMRFRLWDIDLVIRRTIVYGALAGFIGAVYVGVVVVLGGAVGGRTGLSIATTVLVAVAFDPLRRRFQRIANRLVYGERASPYEVMAGVAHRLTGMDSPAEMLPAIAEEVARGVGAERARATLFLASGGRVHGAFPAAEDDSPTFDRTVTLSHQGEPVGELAVGKRPGDPLRPAENRLLEAIGSQVALALHSLRLADRLRVRLADLQHTTAQLEASRRRIVTAQDAERRRLEGDIRDRVEAPLVAIGATIERAERALAGDESGTIAFLDAAAMDANEVQDRLRELARGIFPPLLADKGVASALESRARKLAAPVTVRSAGLTDRFDGHAEAAVYFCCIEAMRSAARRAGDAEVEVTLSAEGDWIVFEVRDGAHGLSEAALTGAELQVMVDRIEAVGGRLEVKAAPEGTVVSGRVPAQPPAAAHSETSRSGSNADFGT